MNCCLLGINDPAACLPRQTVLNPLGGRVSWCTATKMAAVAPSGLVSGDWGGRLFPRNVNPVRSGESHDKGTEQG